MPKKPRVKQYSDRVIRGQLELAKKFNEYSSRDIRGKKEEDIEKIEKPLSDDEMNKLDWYMDLKRESERRG